MTNFNQWITALGLMVALATLSSCNPTELTAKNTRSNVISNDGSYDNKAFIYRDNPTIYAGPSFGPTAPNMNDFIDKRNLEVITTNTILSGNCATSFLYYGGTSTQSFENCIRSLKNTDSTQPLSRKEDRTYIFDVNSDEFYQVNALYHLQKGTDTFLKKLEFAYNKVHSLSLSTPKSIPPYLKDNKMSWFKGVTSIDSQTFKNDYLTSYALCNNENNANFSPAGPQLCFGFISAHPGMYMIQDPTVIYHELGHALVSIMMNLRNSTSNSAQHKYRSNLGSSTGYDEGLSINEGIADYYSFVINKRTHMGEWALGRSSQQSRPMSEDDSMHITGISATPEGRLSYPQYLLYDPNDPDSPFEDAHYAGQITSHYLVALTNSFKAKCSISSDTDGGHDKATSYILLLLAETLSELGDLNAKGIDDYGAPFAASIYFNNLDPLSSYHWAHYINQPTYRRFFQVFSKNINKYISSSAAGLCPSFTRTDSEKLLDDYGLLLFKNYNDNGNSTKDRTLTYSSALYYMTTPSLTSVTESNRRKSVLVSKQLLNLAAKSDATPNAVSYYIIDNRSDIENLLKTLLFKGFAIPLSTGTAGVEYNNSNIKISPGEIVGVIPNLYNGSNSPMAGIQLLANDWDHVDIYDTSRGYFKPCVIDAITTVDQGGEAARTCVTSGGYPDKDYKKLVPDTMTKLFPTDAAAPVCMVQMEEGTSTRWVSQSEFRRKQGLSLVDKDCLGFTSSGGTETDFTYNPHECLVRFIPGANDAFYSKIDPQKNYYETVVKNTERGEFNSGNLLLMEVNRWVPPGTKFRCRLRARFSNCSDCYNDADNGNDEYTDSDLNGYKPFKIINMEFEVND